MTTAPRQQCDVLIVGTGAGGLSTAIVAKKHGLDVLVIEKEACFGGTTAFSGGVLWVPGNPHAAKAGIEDTREAAVTYLRHEAGNFYNEAAVEAFLDNGPRMLEFFERETEVQFVLSGYPDYHPDAPGGARIGRSVTAKAYDATRLGPELKRLRMPLETITFIGMMFNSSNEDLKHFFRATSSLTSATYVAKRLANHLKDLAIHRRGVQITSGNALVARLAKSAFDLGIPILTGTEARGLDIENGAVRGMTVRDATGERLIVARKAVVLASGGYPHDTGKLAASYPHVARGGQHMSPTPDSNTGDGIRMAEAAGARFEAGYPNAAAWMPVSQVPLGKGRTGVFPHLVDRYKPGVIAVNGKGRRFTNEANSYHDVGAAMIRESEDGSPAMAWLICDHATIRKYGLGYAKPAPVPVSTYLRNGYLQSGATIAELASTIGLDPHALEETVRRYNEGAARGEDPEFGRGSTAFNRFLGDPDHKPNPNVAPVGKGPYYALKLLMGDLGTFNGLVTDTVGRVLGEDAAPIPGLYAVGNDRASIMGGNYPGAGITLGPIMTFGYITGRHLADAEDARA
ncbi:FAD-dependent oxidoreductase [Pseudoroseomonas wenyumeiae]|uniref:FAD-dependent oxidoreductase n=1 Tax=Teichococcus wenyumeiae TaxID=2478470 RepID=A0A3A9JLJ9_9PROT|nr:FAD-dependent oxidoreductase [Pseudoroseomonas wenyumeiae]RKK04594.1 FAD-dependent oxidoreductase [Pseudoroseomonas wenyumeiae]RMI17374.1 FAD-dependent oxidoreductase [Pseudoroseomonas wenyumeiae]